MRTVTAFNDGWLFHAAAVGYDAPDSSFEEVTLPHTNTILPYHNFHDQEYQFISTYRKRFTLPQARAGRRVLVEFGGIMTAATVSINGHSFPEQKGGFVPFTYDLTDYIRDDSENVLQVSVDSRERADVPPHGRQVDYLVFGGIYREVELRLVEPLHIHNVQVRSYDLLTSAPRMEIDVYVRNLTASDQHVALVGGLEFWNAEIGRETIPANSDRRITLHSNLGGMPANSFQLWSPGNPRLYDVKVGLYEGSSALSADEVQLDAVTIRTGFRQSEFREDGYYLNGERVFLRGLNRHQMFPYIGMAGPKRLQERDAEILKQYGCSIVRTSHYPQSIHFLNRCDEIGLLVFEEIPGWQFIGDAAWKEISMNDTRAMIERDWNHPSIIIWSIRINESWDDEEFYTRTNALARQLDTTRPTTGVRFFPHSQFLEDVYGYNDFSNGVIEPTQSPWLITEFNGHMFSTKTFDGEERQMEHAVRHARIQAQAISTGGVSGAIGWCAFDYNTHVDFGSGDRICYHGVMDMFRQPKWAAYVYRSQKSPQDEPVLQAASHWTMGDRAGGGNEPLYVLTNCDYVDAFVNGDLHGRFYPASNEFPNLPHPPVRLTGFPLGWAAAQKDLKLVGYVNDQAVAEQNFSAERLPRKLVAYVEDQQIYADGADMTRLQFKITDDYGNRLPYAIQPVTIELLEGDAELIGDNPFPLVGGQAAIFIKAHRTTGTVRVRLSSFRLADAEVSLEIVAP